VVLAVEGFNSATVQITGTWSGQLAFEGTVNDSEWFALIGVSVPDGVVTSSVSNNGQWRMDVAGLLKMRVRSAVINSSGAVVAIRCVSGSYTKSDLSSISEITGDVASGATDSGNPVKVGGVYNSTPPTLTTGQRGDLQVDVNGNTLESLATKIAGEDLTNDVMKVEQRFSGVMVSADTQVKAGAGFLHTLTFAQIDAAPTAGTIIVYDSLSETGTILYSETFDTTVFRGYTVTLDVTFATGLYIGFTTTADIGVTPSYR
jgi:hypothetical protein